MNVYEVVQPIDTPLHLQSVEASVQSFVPDGKLKVYDPQSDEAGTFVTEAQYNL